MANDHLLRPNSLFFIYTTLFVGFILNIFPWGNHVWVPDWLLIALVYWTINEPRRVGIWIGFALGILMDVQTASILGIHSLSYSLVCFIAIAWHRRILDLSTPGQIIHVLPIFLISNAIQLGALYLFTNNSVLSNWHFIVPAFIEAALWPVAKWLLSSPQRQQNQSLKL